jgi:hypothetical protein
MLPFLKLRKNFGAARRGRCADLKSATAIFPAAIFPAAIFQSRDRKGAVR